MSDEEQVTDEAFYKVFQSVFMMFDGKDDRPWGDESRVNKMVFIGRGLDRERLEEGVRGCLV